MDGFFERRKCSTSKVRSLIRQESLENLILTVQCHVMVCPKCERLPRKEYARDEDGDGFCEVHAHTMEGFWSLLRSWLRPHRGLSQEKLPIYLAFFQFVHNVRKRGKALLESLIQSLVTPPPRNTV